MTTLTPDEQADVVRTALTTALAQQWPSAGINPAETAQDMKEFVQSEVWDLGTGTPEKCGALVTALIEKVKAGCENMTPVVLMEPTCGVNVVKSGLNAYAMVTIGFLIPLA